MKQPERRNTGPRATTVRLVAVLLAAVAALHGAVSDGAAQEPAPRLAVAIQPDQAEAILDLLELRARGETVPEEAWVALFATEGYRRMMERERSMDERVGYHRGISDDSFREWAESAPAVDDLPGRRAGLDAWTSVDVNRAATMALDYLPTHARLHGTIYPLYREQENSFVHDLGGERPAIFMYIASGITAPVLEHILAHELHHVGLMAACPRGEDADLMTGILGGFGEGLAVLAAAGGPDGATHPFDGPEVTGNWDRRLDSLAVDMAAFEAFADSVLTGDLTAEEAGRKVFRFSSRDGVPQGALYSLGWHMAVTVERELGRAALIEGMCEPERLLLDYDVAADRITARDPGASLPRWSGAFLDRLRERVALRNGGSGGSGQGR
jgi:hypothetical protein